MFSLVLPAQVFAQVVINEFDVFANPQAVELFNTSDQSVDMNGWYLDDNTGTTYLTISGQLPIAPHSCIVIRGALNLNTATTDTVRLFDSTAPPTGVSPHLIDSYAYTPYTTSGNSYSRNPDGTGSFTLMPSSLGMSNVSRSDCTTVGMTSSPIPTLSLTPIPTPTSVSSSSPTESPTYTVSPSPTLTPTFTPTFTPTPIFTSTPTPISTPMPPIFISEIMVNPSATGHEWVELYNNGAVTVTLNSWAIDDILDGGSSPQVFSATLLPYGYAVIDVSSSMFNNTGDSVRLLDATGHEIEIYIYTSSQVDISWGRQSFDTDLFCLQSPSKGVVNNACIMPTSTTVPTGTPQEKTSKTPTPMPTYTSAPTPTSIPPNNIYLSELYVNTNSGEHEWIEVYNDNRYAVELDTWKVRDASGQTIVTISAQIDAYRYAVVELTSDRMNNTDEQIYLVNPAGIVVDDYAYADSTKGISWGRSPANFSLWCLQNPSRGGYNYACIPQTTATPTSAPTPTQSKTPTLTPRISVNNQKSINASSGGNGSILGESTGRTNREGDLILNFTPHYDTDPQITPSVIPDEELPELSSSTPPSVMQQFSVYFFIMCLCMIIGGLQIAKLWTLYRNTVPAYPDLLG